MKEDLKVRFKDAPWFLNDENKEKFPPILIGGAGGIGSWTALFLTRAGYPVDITDFDILEESNLGGQFYFKEDIGRHKVTALNLAIFKSCGEMLLINIDTIEESYVCESPYVISAFDNMEARKNLFNSWKAFPDKRLFIDGRLSLEDFQIYVVTPDRIEEYEKTLFNDEEVEDLPCTMKQTSHVAAMIGTHITSLFLNYITNIRAEKEVRALPFCYEFFVPLYTN